MILIDTSVILAAQRYDHVHHEVARQWFEQLLDGDDQFGIPNIVWASFLRLTTSPRIFIVPTPLAEAFEFVEAVNVRPNRVLCEPGARHLAILAEICGSSDATGDLMPNAVMAAIARENAASIASFDRDFARFEDLDWIRP